MREPFSHNIKFFYFLLLFVAVFLYTPNLSLQKVAHAAETIPSAVPVDEKALSNKEVGPTIFGIPTGGILSFDGIAYTIANTMISKMTDSIVNWINSGFNGSPSFVGDPGQFFLDTGDRIAGQFIHQLELDDFLCSPFKGIKIAIAINYSKRFEEDIKCKLSDVINNVENYGKFVNGDFGGQGGWDTWFSITQNQQNNPYGTYVKSKIELDSRIANALGIEQSKLNWGSGFLSSQDCLESDVTTHACIKYGPVKTPGSIIENQLNVALGSGQHRLEAADEINEIIGALLNQLVQTVFTQGLASSGSQHGGGITDPNAGNPPLEGTCGANKQTAQAGVTLVTWSVNVQGGDGPTDYKWYGDEIPAASSAGYTRTDNPYKVVYTVPGTKEAHVVVTRGSETKTIQCSNSVNVSNYAPLAVSCSITPGSVPPGGMVTIATNVTGGSGDGACAYKGFVGSSQVEIVKSPFNGDSNGGPGCHASTVSYSQDSGSVQVNVTVNDGVAGQSVTAQCGTVITTP